MTDLRSALEPWMGRLDVPGDPGRVVVGCSGGCDSTALLALAVAAGFDALAVHVDHGLREGSDLEAGVVREVAARLGCAASALAAPVEPGPNLEARARAARHAALDRVRRDVDARAVLLGHTRDDQAETVLLAVLRGAGTTGLGGIPPVRTPFVHPILALGRADTVEICARLGLSPLQDPMNADPAYRRVWVRREALPLLEAGADRALRPVLARQAEVMRAESDFLDGLAERELRALGARAGGERLRCDVAALPVALARRAVRRWLTPDDGYPPPLAAVDAVLEVASGRAPAVEIPGGVRVERAGDRLVRSIHPSSLAPGLETAPPEPADARPGEIAVPGRGSVCGLRVEAWVERGSPERWPDGRWTCVLDADRVGDRLGVRPAVPGDRVAPLGMTGTKRVTTVLAEAGVAPPGRDRHPVVVDAAGTVLWVVGYRVGAPARVTPSTRRWLWVRAEPATVGAEQA